MHKNAVCDSKIQAPRIQSLSLQWPGISESETEAKIFEVDIPNRNLIKTQEMENVAELSCSRQWTDVSELPKNVYFQIDQ